MLSLYRAWLGPSPCVAPPAPPPGAHRPVPRRPKLPPPPSPPPASPSSTTSSELDVERIESDGPEPKKPCGNPTENFEPKRPCADAENGTLTSPHTSVNAVLDVASCDGPVRFSRVLNSAWKENGEWCRPRKRPAVHYYPCKTCGCKFPSYYFVHKHRKRCHAEEESEPEPSTSAATS